MTLWEQYLAEMLEDPEFAALYYEALERIERGEITGG